MLVLLTRTTDDDSSGPHGLRRHRTSGTGGGASGRTGLPLPRPRPSGRVRGRGRRGGHFRGGQRRLPQGLSGCVLQGPSPSENTKLAGSLAASKHVFFTLQSFSLSFFPSKRSPTPPPPAAMLHVCRGHHFALCPSLPSAPIPDPAFPCRSLGFFGSYWCFWQTPSSHLDQAQDGIKKSKNQSELFNSWCN